MWQHIKSICRRKQAENAMTAGTDGEQHGRFPENAPGDFYVDNGMCLSCCLAEAESPNLIDYQESLGHCYFKKQPTTPEEVDQAIAAMAVSDVAAHRYGGTDPAILGRLELAGCERQCDHRLPQE